MGLSEKGGRKLFFEIKHIKGFMIDNFFKRTFNSWVFLGVVKVIVS